MGRVTKESWVIMRRDYEEGLYDLSELAKSCGVMLQTIKKRADSEGWKRPESDRTLRRLKNHRVQMLDAICNSTMEGLRKADNLLSECDCLRDVELHSKTVKNYKDICIGKSPDELLKEETQASSGIEELTAELGHLSSEDIKAVLNESE
ncbi:hypothetical protein Dacet_2221 [Denitrovibrio acetiphilus DSM 12809]|uniref:Uncharacterized protein n=1 Tax=Denitrovibrio acetiphilus (strain DSM 12809 / NBRC 114555 / N2460) TaxID=522772 RepID=D4H2W0_DENA2|nr:hypothetical protein [Denitrovibrio acetiphilus]ADD68983.1 hypothetical protein Dacet_2221 [Denitrovibrio acetiphilus DSM 12809]